MTPSNNNIKNGKGKKKKNGPNCLVPELLLALNITWFPLIPTTEPRYVFPFESLIVKGLPFIFKTWDLTLSILFTL